MARLYLAAAFTEAQRMRRYRDELRKTGHHVTSRWIDSHEEWVPEGIVAKSPELAQGYAIDDIADIMSADAMILFTDVPSTTGGYHVEFGAALMIGKIIILIGQRNNIFQAYEGVEQFDTWAKFIEYVRSVHASSTQRSS